MSVSSEGELFKDKYAKNRASRALTYLLRHGAVKEGLSITDDGYVLLNDILAHPSVAKFDLTFEHVVVIVETCEKQRFKLKEENGVQYIRATQGHSLGMIKSEALLTPITDAKMHPVVCHGTYYEAWPFIKRTGLNRMKRQHVHFASFEPNDDNLISGMRKSCELLIYIDLAAAISGGIEFFISDNKVILTEGNKKHYVPAEYFTKVIDLKTGDDIWNIPTNSAGQTLDYIAVLDFEATCDKVKDRSHVQEIIEIPVAIINTQTQETVAVFHKYVRPVKVPKLSDFCTELTGITQEQVDEADEFKTVWTDLMQFVDMHLTGKKFAFLTCGDWDLKTMLRLQCQVSNLDIPAYFKSWINIKFQFKDFYKRPGRGMAEMLESLDMKLVGRHHSGIDDVKNIVRITRRMIDDGHQFRITSYANASKKKSKKKKNNKQPNNNK